MSAHSTIKITRTAAIQYILTNLMNAGDTEIEDIADIFLDDRLYNCNIVGDEDENDNCLLT